MAIILYAVLGTLAGGLSGLLGIGGGTIIVPGLSVLYLYNHFSSTIIMHMAVGTSLATMIFTSLIALRAHLKRHPLDMTIYKLLLPGVVFGGALGVFAAGHLPTALLKNIFGCFMMLLSIQILLNTRIPDLDGEGTLPSSPFVVATGFAIGFVSGMLGIGGGSLTIPYLIAYRIPMTKTVLLSNAVTFVVSVIGTLMAVAIGMDHIGLPDYSLGYVYLPAVLVVSVFSMISASYAAPFSHRIPDKLLRRIFAVVIFFVAVEMLSSVTH